MKTLGIDLGGTNLRAAVLSNGILEDLQTCPVIKSDGKEGVITYHFTALDPSYLEAFLAGMQVYIDLMK